MFLPKIWELDLRNSIQARAERAAKKWEKKRIAHYRTRVGNAYLPSEVIGQRMQLQHDIALRIENRQKNGICTHGNSNNISGYYDVHYPEVAATRL